MYLGIFFSPNQEQNGILQVIGYGSRALLPAEKNYHIHSGKLEFLELKWAITRQFRDYLFYAESFTVYTDNNLLTYVLSSAKLNAVGQRWVAELADYNFTIKYCSGSKNGDADALSRMLLYMKEFEKFTEEISPVVMNKVVQGVKMQNDTDFSFVIL